MINHHSISTLYVRREEEKKEKSLLMFLFAEWKMLQLFPFHVTNLTELDGEKCSPADIFNLLGMMRATGHFVTDLNLLI